MADTFRDYVKMSFINASGKTANIQLRYPKADLTTLELETAMDLILDKNIFTSTGGDLVSITDGGIVEHSFTDLIA
jgi:hypothetical protein